MRVFTVFRTAELPDWLVFPQFNCVITPMLTIIHLVKLVVSVLHILQVTSYNVHLHPPKCLITNIIHSSPIWDHNN